MVCCRGTYCFNDSCSCYVEIKGKEEIPFQSDPVRIGRDVSVYMVLFNDKSFTDSFYFHI